jgi:EmrB/QacA subfamily drug resistance transporter
MNGPFAPPAALSQAQIRTILIGVVLAMLLGALDQTIVATALPTIGREVNDVQNLSWVVSAYLLSSTAVTPLYGKLSDIHGRRSMLLLAIVVFLGGSVACALSRNIFVLIVARALQGLGGGGLISLGQTIIGDVIVPRERGRYQAYLAAVFVTSSIAGPVLGGFFAEHLHWSVIFWINLPLGLAAYLMTNRVLRMLPRHDRPHRIDALGVLVMVIATVALLLMLTWGGTTYPWASARILALAALSGLSWLVFAVRLASAPEPFIPLGVLGNAVVRDAVLATFFAVGAMIGLTVFVPLYFEAVLGLSASQSGLALIAMMGGTVVGGNSAGRLMARVRHYKRSSVIGLAAGATAMAVLAAWPTSFTLAGVEVLLAIAGFGIGTAFPVTTTAVQNAVPPYEMGTATGVLNFFRSLGGAILVAAFGAILLGSVTAGGDHQSIQALVLQGAQAGTDFTPVFRGVFAAAAVALLLSLAWMTAMEERPLRSHNLPPSGDAA